jgi:hypothetical protein
MDRELRTAYFAGLIDGEGTVAVHAHKARSKQRPVIKVDMTCEVTIRALKEHFGGYLGVKKHRPGNKPQWRWEVTFRKAVLVCEEIRPYLITKAEGADAILRCPKNPQGRPRKE